MSALSLYDGDGKGNTYGLIMTATGDRTAQVSFSTWNSWHTTESPADSTQTYNVSGAIVTDGVFSGSTVAHPFFWVPLPAKITIAPSVPGLTSGVTIHVAPDVPYTPGGSTHFMPLAAGDWQGLVTFLKAAGWPAS